MATREQRSGTDRRDGGFDRRRINRTKTPARRVSGNDSHRNDFVADVSHEIRAPLHAILAMTDLLESTSLTRQQARYIELFRDAGEHLLSLLNELLAFSRKESNDIELSNEPFHLPQLVEGVFELMRTQVQDKDVVFRCYIDPSVTPWRTGDPRRLRQILVNLTSNAIKFTRIGEININVTVGGVDRVLLEVMDTGIGIPEAQQTRIFDSFVQVNEEHAQYLCGVGLGLAICKQLASAMEGTIHVSSRVGVGSNFVCDLPLPAVSEPPVDTTAPRTRLYRKLSLSALSVLVVDDSPLNCRVMENLLGEFGCASLCVSNGQEAINHLSSKHYDLVLMDLRMPVMDGLTATRLIRQLEKEQGRNPVPVIALTAGVLHNEHERARDAGCSDFLAKPVGRDEFVQVLARLLQRFQIFQDQL